METSENKTKMLNIINKVTRIRLAEAFNNYFLNMVEDLHIQIDNDTSPISLLKNAY